MLTDLPIVNSSVIEFDILNLQPFLSSFSSFSVCCNVYVPSFSIVDDAIVVGLEFGMSGIL